MTDVLQELGSQWRDIPPDSEFHSARIADRTRKITDSVSRFRRDLPEYQAGGYRVLDISCGSGIDLEIMRHYGNVVMGMDIQYFELLDSQEIPYVNHNGGDLPYPFKTDEYDLVLCMGSISNYGADWLEVLGEFFRIARKTVYFIPNRGEPFDQNKDRIPKEVDGWKSAIYQEGLYKWEK